MKKVLLILAIIVGVASFTSNAYADPPDATVDMADSALLDSGNNAALESTYLDWGSEGTLFTDEELGTVATAETVAGATSWIPVVGAIVVGSTAVAKIADGLGLGGFVYREISGNDPNPTPGAVITIAPSMAYGNPYSKPLGWYIRYEPTTGLEYCPADDWWSPAGNADEISAYMNGVTGTAFTVAFNTSCHGAMAVKRVSGGSQPAISAATAGDYAASGNQIDASGQPLPTSLTSGQIAAIAAALGASLGHAGQTSVEKTTVIKIATAAGLMVGTFPDCVGISQSACTSALSAAGFTGTPEYDTATFSGADASNPAESIIEQAHAAGTSVSTGTDPLVFTVNPVADDMPMEIFRPLVGEPYADYVARLVAAGYLGSVSYVDLDDSTGDPDLGPDAVPKVSVKLGTSTTATILLLRSWPGTHPKIKRGTDIEIFRNPHDFPTVDPEAPPTDPTDPGDPPVGSGEGCSSCAIDWTPIENLDVGSKFPFGVPTWVSGIFGSISFADSCPSLSIGKPSALGGGTIDIPFCSAAWEDTYRPIVFPILEAVMTLAAIALLGTKIFGIGSDDE